MRKREAYLLCYNLAMAVGWGYALQLGVKGALRNGLAGCMPAGGSVVGSFRTPGR
jgi:hypothetical protein